MPIVMYTMSVTIGLRKKYLIKPQIQGRQIVSHNNLTSKRCEVYIYVNGNLNNSNINSDVA